MTFLFWENPETCNSEWISVKLDWIFNIFVSMFILENNRIILISVLYFSKSLVELSRNDKTETGKLENERKQVVG